MDSGSALSLGQNDSILDPPVKPEDDKDVIGMTRLWVAYQTLNPLGIEIEILVTEFAGHGDFAIHRHVFQIIARHGF